MCVTWTGRLVAAVPTTPALEPPPPRSVSRFRAPLRPELCGVGGAAARVRGVTRGISVWALARRRPGPPLPLATTAPLQRGEEVGGPGGDTPAPRQLTATPWTGVRKPGPFASPSTAPPPPPLPTARAERLSTPAPRLLHTPPPPAAARERPHLSLCRPPPPCPPAPNLPAFPPSHALFRPCFHVRPRSPPAAFPGPRCRERSFVVPRVLWQRRCSRRVCLLPPLLFRAAPPALRPRPCPSCACLLEQFLLWRAAFGGSCLGAAHARGASPLVVRQRRRRWWQRRRRVC